MSLLRFSKKGAIISDETIRWIGYAGALAVASWAVWRIVVRAMS